MKDSVNQSLSLHIVQEMQWSDLTFRASVSVIEPHIFIHWETRQPMGGLLKMTEKRGQGFVKFNKRVYYILEYTYEATRQLSNTPIRK